MNDVSKSPLQPNPAASKPSTAAPIEGGWHPFQMFREEMDRLFDDFMSGFPFRRSGLQGIETDPGRWWSAGFGMSFPAVDVIASDKVYEIRAELPGLEEKDVEISLMDDLLTLTGEKQSERETKDESHYVSERRYGSFRRSFRLPDVDPGKIKARFKNGVLTITAPKNPEAQAKRHKIAIQTN